MGTSFCRIDLTSTRKLHEKLVEIYDLQNAEAVSVLSEIQSRAKRDGPRHDSSPKKLENALTAYLLDQASKETLDQVSRNLHFIVEQVLNHIIASRELLQKYFPDHRRIFPYLQKSAGSNHWQMISRFDFAVTPEGDLKLLELNTGCPGGYAVSCELAAPTLEAFEKLGVLDSFSFGPHQHPASSSMMDALLALEKQSGIEPGLVAILNDENDLMFELEYFAAEIKRRGREAIIARADDLEYDGKDLSYKGVRVSATYNKFRISTPKSPNHCWREGFESRYDAFLRAHQDNAMATLNSICAMSIAEDKGMLALFFEPEIRTLLSEEDRAFLDALVPRTSHLHLFSEEKREKFLSRVRAHRDDYVIKPANEGRGFGVVVGKGVTQKEWDALCQFNSEMPTVVQEYVESVTLPVANVQDGNLRLDEMFLTLATAMSNGEPTGIVSRVSRELVTNVAQSGYLQAVFEEC